MWPGIPSEICNSILFIVETYFIAKRGYKFWEVPELVEGQYLKKESSNSFPIPRTKGARRGKMIFVALVESVAFDRLRHLLI
ncbi:MAG: hypothetical protein ABIQ11_01620, partial [Saprospiraceae bacterium]